jgi:predicted dehydrogenase
VTQGANPLTIATGHAVDAMRYALGDFARVSSMVSTQAREWFETDTGRTVEVTSPDNIQICGKLVRGAVASAHVGAAPWAGSGFRLEIYGRDGTLLVTGNVSSQRGEMLRIQGAQKSHELVDLPIPDKYTCVPPEFPRGDPFNVGQMYALFADAVRTGVNRLPTFETAVELHRFLDTVLAASETGDELEVR